MRGYGVANLTTYFILEQLAVLGKVNEGLQN